MYNAKIFDNSINITTVDRIEFFFTSFVYRDLCYDVLYTLKDSMKEGKVLSQDIEAEEKKSSSLENHDISIN